MALDVVVLMLQMLKLQWTDLRNWTLNVLKLNVGLQCTLPIVKFNEDSRMQWRHHRNLREVRFAGLTSSDNTHQHLELSWLVLCSANATGCATNERNSRMPHNVRSAHKCITVIYLIVFAFNIFVCINNQMNVAQMMPLYGFYVDCQR